MNSTVHQRAEVLLQPVERIHEALGALVVPLALLTSELACRARRFEQVSAAPWRVAWRRGPLTRSLVWMRSVPPSWAAELMRPPG
jgi:hypothetical protein